MTYKHIPYRGDGNPNIPTKRRPPSAEEKKVVRGFGCLVLVVGIALVYFIVTAQTGFVTFAAIAGLIYVIIFFFAIRDALGIEATKPDNDKADNNDPTMFNDYMAQVEWTSNHRKRHHPSHWSAPEPEWRYHAIKTTSDKVIRDLLKRNDRLFWVGLMPGIFIFVGIAMIFGVSSPTTIIVISISCLAFLVIYLMKD